MPKPKIRATKQVRELLVELDGLFESFNETVRVLADRSLKQSAAVNAGVDKKYWEGRIIGCAYRINKASRE